MFSCWLLLIHSPTSFSGASLVAQLVKNLPAMWETWVRSQLVKNLPAMWETWVGRSPGEEKGYPLQYSSLENSMDCIVHGVSELDRTEWLSLSRTHTR